MSLSIAQRGCWCSRAAVWWREGLIGGDLVLHQRAGGRLAPSILVSRAFFAASSLAALQDELG